VTFVRWPRSFGLCHPNLIHTIIIIIIDIIIIIIDIINYIHPFKKFLE